MDKLLLFIFIYVTILIIFYVYIFFLTIILNRLTRLALKKHIALIVFALLLQLMLVIKELRMLKIKE